jgi:hypothetical protein
VDKISIFADSEISNLVLESLQFHQNRYDLKLYGYLIKHLHLIVEGENISNQMRKFKSYMARQIIDTLKSRKRKILLKKLSTTKHDQHKDSEYQVWQEGFHPKQINTLEMMIQKLEYSHYNPVKAGFVDRIECWKNSSARNYLGWDGILPVTLFNF